MTEPGTGLWTWPQTDRGGHRRFAAVMALALGGVGAWLWHAGTAVAAVGAVLAGSAAFAAAGLLVPGVLALPYGLWMYLARLLGWVNTHLLLGLVFYTMFTLLGAAMRLLRYDPLQRRLDPERPSYWQQRPPSRPPAERYERQF